MGTFLTMIFTFMPYMLDVYQTFTEIWPIFGHCSGDSRSMFIIYQMCASFFAGKYREAMVACDTPSWRSQGKVCLALCMVCKNVVEIVRYSLYLDRKYYSKRWNQKKSTAPNKVSGVALFQSLLKIYERKQTTERKKKAKERKTNISWNFLQKSYKMGGDIRHLLTP